MSFPQGIFFFIHRHSICRSRRAALPFAKGSAVVREEQRGRSRTANKNDKQKQENALYKDRKWVAVSVHIRRVLLYNYTWTNLQGIYSSRVMQGQPEDNPGCPCLFIGIQSVVDDKDSRTTYSVTSVLMPLLPSFCVSFFFLCHRTNNSFNFNKFFIIYF